MNVRFNKHPDGLIPAIVQDASTKKVLMLGYMNALALEKTIQTKKVTFFSRSKGRLWMKGEESGHFLELDSLKVDCDGDALLVYVRPKGPTCHKGTGTCWGEANTLNLNQRFIDHLESIILERQNTPLDKPSYVKSLLEEGTNKVAQKLGEEAIELIIEAKDNNDNLFLNEAADLLFHYLILLRKRGYCLKDVEQILATRHP